MNDLINYNYYIYSQSIARIDNNSNLEIKNHQTNAWTKVGDANFYRRILEEGDLVSKKEADDFYKEKKIYLNSLK
ncbi:MAG: hypothetical protein H0V82_11735 [Candidatus Protochlamydia sp.]|nr:hypothetical protein [Candidatus Protochlamydia sp.]